MSVGRLGLSRDNARAIAARGTVLHLQLRHVIHSGMSNAWMAVAGQWKAVRQSLPGLRISRHPSQPHRAPPVRAFYVLHTAESSWSFPVRHIRGLVPIRWPDRAKRHRADIFAHDIYTPEWRGRNPLPPCERYPFRRRRGRGWGLPYCGQTRREWGLVGDVQIGELGADGVQTATIWPRAISGLKGRLHHLDPGSDHSRDHT